jgi:hypothetical protein
MLFLRSFSGRTGTEGENFERFYGLKAVRQNFSAKKTFNSSPAAGFFIFQSERLKNNPFRRLLQNRVLL